MRDEHYLKKEGEDFSRVIDRLVVDFEMKDKMVLDTMFPGHIEKYYLKVDGLKRNKPKRFRIGQMQISKQVSLGNLGSKRVADGKKKGRNQKLVPTNLG